MVDFTERENWITITTIMKTSSISKNLPKDVRDQLFLSLHRQFAGSLGNDDIKDIEAQIVKLSKEVMMFSGSEAMKMIGTGDMKETMNQLGQLIGKDDAKKIMDTMAQQHDKELQ